MLFSTRVASGGGNATGIVVPEDVVTALGRGTRVPVVVTIGGYSYRSTIARMHGDYLVPLAAEHRAAAGVAAGDEVEVDLVVDDAPRTVDVPEDLAAALAAVPGAREAFDGFAFSHRKEWVRAVEDAKKPETRAARIARTVEQVMAKRG